LKHHDVRHFPGKQLRDRAVPLIGEVGIKPDVERRQDQLVAVDGTCIVATIPAIRRRVVGSYLYRAPTEEHGIYFPRRDGRRPAIVHPCRLRCDVLMPSACLGERPGHTASFSRVRVANLNTSAGQRDFCVWFDFRARHQRRAAEMRRLYWQWISIPSGVGGKERLVRQAGRERVDVEGPVQ